MKIRSVLVVDDHEEFRRVVRIWLESAGYRVGCAASGNRARELFEQSPFDVVITDVVMPEGGGLELITRLKNVRRDVLVIAVSGGGPQLTGMSCLHDARIVGADALLLKPFKPDQLLDTIRRLLDPAARRATTSAPPRGFGADTRDALIPARRE